VHDVMKTPAMSRCRLYVIESMGFHRPPYGAARPDLTMAVIHRPSARAPYGDPCVPILPAFPARPAVGRARYRSVPDLGVVDFACRADQGFIRGQDTGLSTAVDRAQRGAVTSAVLRIGSSEIAALGARPAGVVHCRIGSSEMPGR